MPSSWWVIQETIAQPSKSLHDRAADHRRAQAEMNVQHDLSNTTPRSKTFGLFLIMIS